METRSSKAESLAKVEIQAIQAVRYHQKVGALIGIEIRQDWPVWETSRRHLLLATGDTTDPTGEDADRAAIEHRCHEVSLLVTGNITDGEVRWLPLHW